MTELHQLARQAGLQIEWEDALGAAQRVADDALVGVLGALGLPADSAAAIAQSKAALADDAAFAASFVSGDVGAPIMLPGAPPRAGRAELILENGERRVVALTQGQGGTHCPPIDIAGYHMLRLDDRELRVAVAPARCFAVADAAPGRRVWGASVQIPGLRGAQSSAYGDFGTLADSARSFAARGADALAISPIHALFPADPSRYSPYAPSSRLFLNILYADPALIGAPLPPQPAPDLIDWTAAVPQRLADLRAIHARSADRVRESVAAFRQAGGQDLERHAVFDALHAHFFASGAHGWQDWPVDYHDPAGPAVARFAAAHAAEVDFFLFLQWLAAEGLAAAQAAAKDAGMAIGLIADLAVGMDRGGSHAWSRPDDLLPGLSIGAPPDLLGPDGQNWGITGFSPHALRRTGFDGFVQTLRTALRSAGGIRIDHALGLRRLWVVPEGGSPKDGAYLTMPLDDMLRLTALESQRAQAVVIGEDLGTVPEGLRPAMEAKAMLGMRVLWFEQDDDGHYVPPADWQADAAAMTGTHDLATVAGWWRGRDIDWTWKLGRTSRSASEADDRAKRAEARAILWQAFTDAGVTDAPQPAPDATDPVVDAAAAFVGETPCVLAILPIEDISGLIEQPNLPGTIDEHPNWRRRMPAATDQLLAHPAVATRIETLNRVRAA